MRYLYLLLFFSLTFSSSTLLAQQDDSTVWYIADWQKGDIKKYKVTKKTTEFKNGVQTKDEVYSYYTNVQVTKATKKYFELEWMPGKTIVNTTPIVPENVKSAISKHKITTIKYRTDLYGAFLGIENWKELSKMSRDIMQEVIKSGTTEEQEKLRKVVEPMLQAYSSKQGLERKIYTELTHFHSMYGAGFSRYDTVTYDEQFPNLYGGAPIKAIGKVYYPTNIEDPINTTLLVNEITLDPEDSRRMVEGFVNRITNGLTSAYTNEEEMQKRLEQIKQMINTMDMDVRDYNTFLFSNKQSWPVRITTKRETNVKAENETQVKIEETIIEHVL